MATGVCEFCRKECTFIKAHIFPRWCYKELYPNKKVNAPALVSFRIGSSHTQRSFIGPTDSSILCQNCDSRFGTYDEYARELFVNTSLTIEHAKREYLVFSFNKANIDQKRLKLFVLSVLYRASISKLDEFRDISLTQEKIEELRTALLNEEPGPSNFYSVILHKFLPGPLGIEEQIMFVSYHSTLNGMNCVNLSFSNGFNAIVKIDTKPYSPASRLRKVIVGSGELRVLSYQKVEEHPSFDDMVKAVQSIKK